MVIAAAWSVGIGNDGNGMWVAGAHRDPRRDRGRGALNDKLRAPLDAHRPPDRRWCGTRRGAERLGERVVPPASEHRDLPTIGIRVANHKLKHRRCVVPEPAHQRAVNHVRHLEGRKRGRHSVKAARGFGGEMIVHRGRRRNGLGVRGVPRIEHAQRGAARDTRGRIRTQRKARKVLRQCGLKTCP